MHVRFCLFDFETFCHLVKLDVVLMAKSSFIPVIVSLCLHNQLHTMSTHFTLHVPRIHEQDVLHESFKRREHPFFISQFHNCIPENVNSRLLSSG